ncbi:guanylate kinase [Desulfoluna spongiiphila]|uniref:Guanylate kinase n=1 Tax=Desulfoluna spongiiphila TaxID=419481 RepID=A0A1G5AHT9_9BACT|nr:guanylate kinase [Desulfoluna spongiiphila]SCX77430.1 guanylate kinase [Desulfoluna spongiiphila]VVS90575.1 guanylate kinase/l-type calcium channel beta subunit [Desulfoluna spongiiphila]
MKRRGNIYIVSAPSGAGKSTLCQELLTVCPDITYSISHTTRAPRGGEEDGRDYHFVTREAFQERIAKGLMAEWAEVHGNYYGTSLETLEATVAQGIDVLLDIDVQGARQMCEALPECVTIFIMPPSVDELRARLEKRGTDSPETIEKRMANAVGEMDQRDFYRHVIVNDDLAEAVAAFVAVVKGCREGVNA